MSNLYTSTNFKSFLILIYVLIIATISFTHFSPIYAFGLGSDQAIPILQAFNFRIPEDLYYRGQDRLGSIIPLISNIIYRLTGINHIWVISVTNYVFLVLGCLTIAKFFKTDFSKILFPIFWFLPILLFIGLVEIGLPQGVSSSFFSFFLYLRIFLTKSIRNRFISWIFLFIACWTSDLIFFAAAIYYFLYFVKHIKLLKYKLKTYFKHMFFSFIEVSTIIAIVYFFKQITEGTTKEYNTNVLNSWDEILDTFQHLKIKFLQTLAVQPNFQEALLFIFILTSILILTLSGYIFKINIKTKKNFLLLFFFIYAIINLIIFFTSHWVYLNGFRPRYLIDMYIAFTIFTLLILEHRNIRKLLIIPCVSGLIYSLSPHYYPEKRMSRLNQLKEIKTLGECTIISKYWSAYEFGCVYPDMVVGLPHDRAVNRHPTQIHPAFEQPKIYLHIHLWLDNFPDTIEQYDYILKKTEFEKNIYQDKFVEYKVIHNPLKSYSFNSNENTCIN